MVARSECRVAKHPPFGGTVVRATPIGVYLLKARRPTRKITVRTKFRGETFAEKTEAFFGCSWYTTSRDRMTYNTTGRRRRERAENMRRTIRPRLTGTVPGNLQDGPRRMGRGYDLSQCKGALKGTMDRCEFTDKTLALSQAFVAHFVSNVIGFDVLSYCGLEF